MSQEGDERPPSFIVRRACARPLEAQPQVGGKPQREIDPRAGERLAVTGPLE